MGPRWRRFPQQSVPHALSQSCEKGRAEVIWPGEPSPLGSTFDGTGTTFSLFSELAERVELCLVDDQGNETRVDLPKHNEANGEENRDVESHKRSWNCGAEGPTDNAEVN